MSKFKTAVFFLFVLFALTVQGKEIIIKGSIKNIGKSPYIYLSKALGTEFYKIDSVKHQQGDFKFKLKQDLPRGMYAIGNDEMPPIVLILGGESPMITGDVKNPVSLIIKDSKENEVYAQFQKFGKNFSDQQKELEKTVQTLLPERETNPEKFKMEIGKLQVRYDSLERNRNSYYKKIQTENKDLFVGKLAGNFVIPDSVSKENFFKADDFKDVELTAGDILSSKMSIYLQKFVPAELEPWKAESENLTKMTSPGSPQREVAYITFIKLFSPYEPVYAKKLAVSYQGEFPNSKVANKLLASAPSGPPAVGDLAPDIKLTDPNGSTISLSSLRGKIVLIDFWASWCGPCRMENPNVVNVYEKYKDKGFTIFSVSLDNNKDNWLKAIEKDKLVWKSHVSDLKGWQSGAASLYQVKGIPATFLVDKKGKIIATNLRGESLEEKLKEYCQ